jgi:hypothetical protein
MNTPLKEAISFQSWPVEHVGIFLQYLLNSRLVGHANPSRPFEERKSRTLYGTELTPQSSVPHYSQYIDWAFSAGFKYDVCWKYKFEVSYQLVWHILSAEECALLGYYEVSSDNSLPTFPDNLWDPSSWVRVGPISCPGTSVCNSTKEWGFHLLMAEAWNYAL